MDDNEFQGQECTEKQKGIGECPCSEKGRRKKGQQKSEIKRDDGRRGR